MSAIVVSWFWRAAGIGSVLAACSYSTNKQTAEPVKVSASRESVQRDFVAVSCLRCHEQATERNRFVDLTDVERLLKSEHVPGGPHRPPLIKPGCPKQSFFLSIVREKKMPPSPAEPISVETLKAVEDWIVSLKPGAGPTCAGDDEPGGDDEGPDEPGSLIHFRGR